MGMTIDDAIKQLSMHKFYVLGNDYEAVQEAIATMRKYQKIEEIVGNYGFDTSWLCLKKIGEVIDDATN